MANLPDETITTVLNLQRQLLEIINRATIADSTLLEQYGETEEKIPELDELQNVIERAETYYLRFYTLLLRIAKIQPIAVVMLDLLQQSIEEAQQIVAASEASIREIKRNWNLP